MDLHQYEDLQDGLSAESVRAVLDVFLREEALDDRTVRFQKLDILCDRQWHTYEPQDAATNARLQEWLESRWEWDDDFLALAMGVYYSFGLSKDLFERALQRYSGPQRREYQRMADKSPADTIDPYWSMKSNPNP